MGGSAGKGIDDVEVDRSNTGMCLSTDGGGGGAGGGLAAPPPQTKPPNHPKRKKKYPWAKMNV